VKTAAYLQPGQMFPPGVMAGSGNKQVPGTLLPGGPPVAVPTRWSGDSLGKDSYRPAQVRGQAFMGAGHRGSS
jgi:hypothetical protein